jgi:hypothetical protein
MTEIKRYAIDPYLERPLERILLEHPEGDWVAWEDVEKLLAEMREELTPLPPTEG